MLRRSGPVSFGAGVRTIAAELEHAGLRDLIACFDPFHPRQAHWLAAHEGAPPELKPLLELFILGGAVDRHALAGLSQAALDVMEQGGVLQPAGEGKWWLGGLMLLPVHGLWLLCHVPQPNPTLYFGDDSIGLASRLTAERGHRALDLCAGPGIQALRLAQMGADVVAVEINPMAAALASLNAVANGLEDRVDIRIGNLFDSVGDERFDRVTANPPLLPMPDDLPYPFVGHGGPDGLTVTRQIIERLSDHLAPSGIARLLGTTLSDGFLPLSLGTLEDMAAACRLDIMVFITAHHSLAEGATYFEGLAATCAGTGDITVEAARKQYRTFLKSVGATHLCAYFLHIVAGDGRLRLIDVATDPAADLWFVT